MLFSSPPFHVVALTVACVLIKRAPSAQPLLRVKACVICMSPPKKKAMGYSVNILHIDLKNDLFVCLFLFLSKKDWSLFVMKACVIDWFSFVFFAFLLSIVQKHFIFLFFKLTQNFFADVALFVFKESVMYLLL